MSFEDDLVVVPGDACLLIAGPHDGHEDTLVE